MVLFTDGIFSVAVKGLQRQNISGEKGQRKPLGTSQIFEQEDFKEIAQLLFQNLETPACFLPAHSHGDRSRHRVCTHPGSAAAGSRSKPGQGCSVQPPGHLWAAGLCLGDIPAPYACTKGLARPSPTLCSHHPRGGHSLHANASPGPSRTGKVVSFSGSRAQ